ncbi:MAG: amino acid ABC transporter permease [Paenibacillus macerans]|uniref:ABC transporter permease subunit n=1 Tax=Paenibacillus macerans TaxID=44252 RepID=A0A090Z5Z3_PAEMA|nr:amino acid ABC transporter permease [Paenibacillus macerans]KFN05793.1 amino ABC transporter, permease, 3-TM region, His/Glu/Gln/Arg/opine family domain protein [Paenibacillus macerans]MBS5910222.1 amino acid ABC transporter permease [Paenibacillus macerans]MCY7559826.1 amino acid ABC transporter permease [Paenibacillus macerans]MDU7476325.1 amino acid ABC transporter permease [Paenibacillus macerans]MEC0151534.1 amino acid ABC transporter permease [Paenibacillus macerans]
MDFSILTDYFGTFMEGFRGTVVSSLLALVGSFALGTLIAVFRIGSIRALRWFGTGYVEFIRNIPLLLVVYIFYYGPAALELPLDGFTAGTIGLAVYTSSFIAEAIRAGIMSIPRGQTEAARSSGLSYAQTMVHIVLPQAIRLVIPPLGNQFINLIKNSSVLTIVAGLDLMYFADIVNTDTFQTFDTYVFVALFYLALTLPLSYGVRVWERKLERKY